MNQGKLEVVKQEMARVTVDMLGISELKWTGMDSKELACDAGDPGLIPGSGKSSGEENSNLLQDY